MRRKCLAALGAILAVALTLALIPWGVGVTMPDYPAALAAENVEEKITGVYLVAQAARNPESILIFGSSELKTTDICTHPANFFADTSLQVDLVGRGSCQSLIHALAIGAQGENLRGRKVVLITAPQSYTADGIASDLFMANYSQQQLLNILNDDAVPEDTKTYLSKRIQKLFAQYEADTGRSPEAHTAGDALSAAWAAGMPRWYLAPYVAMTQYLLNAKDMVRARRVMKQMPAAAESITIMAPDEEIDWAAAEDAALRQAAEMVTNNEFWMQDGYYTTYIGAKLRQQAGKDEALSYAESPEYGDLRCLLDLCALREVDVLFVHVPMHGAWNDYTKFSAEKREEYYEKVRNIVAEYRNVTLLDLTGFEYEPYFLCDTMHLGWKGWLTVDRAMLEFYYGR